MISKHLRYVSGDAGGRGNKTDFIADLLITWKSIDPYLFLIN